MYKFLFLLLFGLSSLAMTGQDIDDPKIKWRFKAQGPIRGSSVIVEDKIYFGSSDGFVYCLNKEQGNLIWKKQTNGAITGTPTIAGSSLYITNRDNSVWAMDARTGKILWKFKMQPILPDLHAGWEYFMASPVVFENSVFIGSGDGHLYVLDSGNGKPKWKFKTNGRIRATPLIDSGTVYQPSNDGYIYVLDVDNGNLLWKFETRGATYNPQDFNFDRSSICTQPQIREGILYFGSRDGNTYAVDLKTRKEKWNFSYGPTWAMATAVSNDAIFVGWSTNNLTCALDLENGTEKWQFKSGGHVYTKPLVLDDGVYIGSADGKVYRLNKHSGEKIWEYTIGHEVYSSIIYDTHTIFFGSDDGFFYALEKGTKPYKAVYQPSKIEGNAQFVIVDKKIVPYLAEKGFEKLGNDELSVFISDRIQDQKPSVVVFAFPIVPKDIFGNTPKKGMLLRYLQTGGKIVWLGDVPNFYELDDTGNFKRDPAPGANLLEIEFTNPTDSGNYYSKATQQGLNWGLPTWFKTTGSIINPETATPLAYDEYGRVNTWLKKFNPRPGSGFVSCRTWAWNVDIKEKDLQLIHQLATYQLE
jgi:outer membrane protein assembly factor BamB